MQEPMENKQKKTPIWSPIVWSACALVWCVLLFVDIRCGKAEEGIVVMHAIAAIASFIAAFGSIKCYRRDKNDPNKE